MESLKGSKLARFLRMLSQEDRSAFQKWLSSPWANTNKNLIHLYKHLLKHHFDFEKPQLSKSSIFKQLHKNKPYNNKVLNNLMTQCVRQIEKFLAHQVVANNQETQTALLREAFLQRKANVLFKESTRDFIHHLESNSTPTYEDHLKLATNYQRLYDQPKGDFKYFSQEALIQKASHHLDIFYALRKYKLWHEAKDRASILNKDKSIGIPAKLQDFFQEQFDHPAIPLYQNRLSRTQKVDWNSFIDYKTLFFQSYSQLSPDLQQDFFIFCINDAILLSTQGHLEAFSAMLELYQFGLKKELLLVNQQITAITFNNILLLAAHQDQITFGETFAKNYQNKLPPEIQEEMQLWASAQIKYMKGLHSNCMDLIMNHKFQNPFVALQSRVTLLKANFEFTLENPDHNNRFQSYCLSSEKFILRNNWLSRERRNAYIRYIHYIKKMITFRQKNLLTIEKLQKLKAEIDNESNLFGQPWLHKKIDEYVQSSIEQE